MYAVVRLEAIDTENLSLGNVTVYPSSELYLFSAAADLYEEQVLLNYFLLTATPFLIENMEEENRQEQAELR